MNAQDNKPAEHVETSSVKPADSRRKFIQKAAAGTVLTTLPASTVWGVCTVSGALSGGSQVEDSCKLPLITGGRSPGYWKGNGNYHGGFSVYGPTQEGCLATAINTFKTSTTITLEPGVTLNLQDGLNASGSFSFHLSAAYLNAYFGFYTLPITVGTDILNTPEELVQHLYATSFRYDVDTVKTAIEASYTDGISAYSGFGC